MTKRGWQGAVLRALRGRDFTLTVLAAEEVGERYRRLSVHDGGLLTACAPHPTLWLRLWFDDDGTAHQRAYTVVDPDSGAGTFDLEFVVHDGLAARWACAAAPGDTVGATLYGSRFEAPRASRRLHLVGDPASLPAINSVLDAHPSTPASIWLEAGHRTDRQLPVRARACHDVRWVDRGTDTDAGCSLVAQVRHGWADGGADTAADWFWLAPEATTTRILTRHLLHDLGVGRDRVSSMAYWRTV